LLQINADAADNTAEQEPFYSFRPKQGTAMEVIAEANSVARHEAARATAAAAASAAGSTGRTSQGGEFLTFRLGAEEYGIDILRVQEIRSYEQPTRIANAPSFIKGVVNLRGVIVPIIDLRLKLGCDTAEYNTFTVVVVLNVHGRVVGAVVDSHQACARAEQQRGRQLHHRHWRHQAHQRARQGRNRCGNRTHADPDGHRRPDEQHRHGLDRGLISAGRSTVRLTSHPGRRPLRPTGHHTLQ